jgi:hypothetical protein
MSYLTKIDGYPDADDAVPGMAFFTKTGPPGMTCGLCRHYGYYRINRKGKSVRALKCAKYKALNCGRDGDDISKNNQACKYFEGKP